MAGRKNGKKELVQIDADWLLGESMDRPLLRRSWFLRIVLLLGFVVAALWSWPYASKQWLPWVWKQQLSRFESESFEAILPIRLARNATDPKHNEPAITTIRGIEKLPNEKLFPLLSSTLPKIVQEASKELVQRGMTTPQLELAIDLAQGNIEQRMMAMDRLVRDQDLDPIPWLIWMAEQSDLNVRRKAVSLLGSVSNPNAIQTLRRLKLREPDSAIVEQISQVLLAFGKTDNSRRYRNP